MTSTPTNPGNPTSSGATPSGGPSPQSGNLPPQLPNVQPGLGVPPQPFQLDPGYLPPGFSQIPPSGSRRRWLWIFVIISVVTILIWLGGTVLRGEPLPIVQWVSARAGTQIEMVDARPNATLMREIDGDSSRILVKRSDQAAWFLVSGDDTTATNPAMSPDTTQVAYVSKRDGGQIAVVSLITTTIRTTSPIAMQAVGQYNNFGDIGVCSWTPISWSLKGNRIAFFGCGTKGTFSVAVVGELNQASLDLKIAPESKNDSAEPRQLMWLDNTRLTFTMVSIGTLAGPSVHTVTVPE